MSLWKRLKRLWTLLSTEEIVHTDGTSEAGRCAGRLGARESRRPSGGPGPSLGSGPFCFDEDLGTRSQKMIPYMDLNEQVDSDFTRAGRRALLRRVLARLRNNPASNRLLSFDDVSVSLQIYKHRELRLCTLLSEGSARRITLDG
jgi:hypothetical protein